MKTVNTLLFFTIFLLGVFTLDRDAKKQLSLSAFLPADTLVYFEQKDGREYATRFHNSRLGRALRSIDYLKILQDAGADMRYMQFLDEQLQTLNVLGDDPLLQAMLGKKFGLGLFGHRDWSATADNLTDYLKKHMILISNPLENEVSFDARLAEYLQNRSVTAIHYGRHVIQRIPINSMDAIALAEVDDFVLLSLEERVLRESLDLYDQKKATLNLTPAFLSFTREMEGAERFVYCAVEELQNTAKSLIQLGSTPQQKTFLEEFSSFPGVRDVAYGGWRKKKLLKNRVIIRLNPGTMDERLQKMVATSPSINDSLPYVTNDVLLYYWSNSLELQLLWEMYVSRYGADSSEVLELEQEIRQIFGYDVNNLINMIGSNIGVIVRENRKEQFVPIPDFAILLKLTDADAAGKAIQQALKNLDIKLKKGSHRNIEYFSWGLDPNESLQPVYAIHRNYLILANTLNILRTILDTPINNSRLIATKGFKELDPGFQTLNNSVCYIDQARLLLRLQEFVGWAGTMLAIQDRNAAEKSKALIDNFIDPLFWGMSMYEKSATRTYVKNGRVYIESQIRYIN